MMDIGDFGHSTPGSTTFFISDVHLGCDTPQLEEIKKDSLFSFLEMVHEEGKELFILGDLFDFWFEYGRVVPGMHTGLVSWLWRLHQRGITVHYIVGNHDFWAGRFFEEELGITVHKEPVIMELGGKKAFLTHGDGHGKGDTGYKILKRVLRSRLTIFLFGLLHPRIGLLLARVVSAASRGDYEKKSLKASKALKAYALKRLAEDDIDLFLTGHTHRPEFVKQGNKCFLNTGDWIRHHTYAAMRDGELKLMKWGTRVVELTASAAENDSRQSQ